MIKINPCVSQPLTRFGANIHSFKANTTTPGISWTFCYLTINNLIPSQDEFAELLTKIVVPYCLPRRRINSNETYTELVEAAKKSFVKSKKKNKVSGEPAEVALFLFLEKFLAAPRLIAKMSLKTNANMEVNGADAIHVGQDPVTTKPIIYWGEAKLYKSFSKALTNTLESFINLDRDFEVNLIQNNVYSELSPNQISELKKYLNPYKKSYCQEVFACLPLSEPKVYKKLSGLSPVQAEAKFKVDYQRFIDKVVRGFAGKIKQRKKLAGRDFHLFLLPLCNVQDFRKSFFTKLGLPY